MKGRKFTLPGECKLSLSTLHFQYFKDQNKPEKSSTTCRSNFVQNLVNCFILFENSTALTKAPSSSLRAQGNKRLVVMSLQVHTAKKFNFRWTVYQSNYFTVNMFLSNYPIRDDRQNVPQWPLGHYQSPVRRSGYIPGRTWPHHWSVMTRRRGLDLVCSISVIPTLGAQKRNFTFTVKGDWSRKVNKLVLKRRFCCSFDRPYHRDFPLLFSKWRCHFEDRLLCFVKKQTTDLYVVRWGDMVDF